MRTNVDHLLGDVNQWFPRSSSQQKGCTMPGVVYIDFMLDSKRGYLQRTGNLQRPMARTVQPFLYTYTYNVRLTDASCSNTRLAPFKTYQYLRQAQVQMLNFRSYNTHEAAPRYPVSLYLKASCCECPCSAISLSDCSLYGPIDGRGSSQAELSRGAASPPEP